MSVNVDVLQRRRRLSIVLVLSAREEHCHRPLEMLSKQSKQNSKNLFTLLCCKKVIKLYKNPKGTVQNKIIRSALASDKARFHPCIPYEQCPTALSLAA